MNVVPLGYKRTDVGVIPEDWEVCELGDCCSLYQPHTISQKKLDSYAEFPAYGANGIIGNYHCFNHEKSEIIIGCRGTCGAVNYSLPRSWINGNAMVVHVHSSARVLQKYLLQHLRCFGGIKETIITGGTQPQITRKPLSHVRVFFPSDRGEQKKILGVLSDVDELLATKENLLAKERAIKRGAMQELLTGKRRLPGFPVTPMKRTAIGEIPADWSVVYLGNICEITTGRVDVNSGDELGMYPFFTCAKKMSFSNEFAFDAEAILIAGNGDVGTLHYYKGKFQAYQRTYVLSNFSVSVAYLLHNLEFRLIMELSKGKVGTTLSYIRLEQLKGFGFPCPSSVTERDAIETVLSDMDREIGALDAEIAKLRDMKAGIMQELLTGKIRLKK